MIHNLNFFNGSRRPELEGTRERPSQPPPPLPLRKGIRLSSVKQIASPGWMHETSAQGWCTGKTQRDGMGREVGGGVQDGEHT